MWETYSIRQTEDVIIHSVIEYHSIQHNIYVRVSTTGYGLKDQMVGVRVPMVSRIYLLHVIQTYSGAHAASY
jgi:hypothetical protein